MKYDYFLIRNGRWVVGVRDGLAFTFYGDGARLPRPESNYDSGWSRAEFAPRAVLGQPVYNMHNRKWDAVYAVRWNMGYHYVLRDTFGHIDFLVKCS